MEPLFYDTETCGLHSMPVLIQYAIGQGDIKLHSIWTEMVEDTLCLIENMMHHDGGLVGFNNAFDSFHLTKIYNCLLLLKQELGSGEYKPFGYINEIARLEPLARDGVALKPKHVLDLMLYARKGPYQSLMDRDDVRIRTVPDTLAYRLCDMLNATIEFKDVYFERSKNKQRWRVLESRDKDGDLKAGFKDVVLKFAPSTALKALAVDALGLEQGATRFQEISVSKKFMPNEFGFAPFALAGVMGRKSGKPWLIRTSEENWCKTWPAVIEHHIAHWAYNPQARMYAKNDIEYTRGLYYHFLEHPCDGIKLEFDDDDSILSFMVGTVRWHGFAIDMEGIKALRLEATRLLRKVPTAPVQVKKYLSQVMSPLEQLALPNTKAITLEAIAKWNTSAGARAKEVIEARHAMKEIELYDKLLIAGRFHTSFKVIGALSSRMSGADGLNAQGIKRTTNVRSKFLLNWDPEHYVLCGGDFGGFEMTIMDAAYYDPDLHPIIAAKAIHLHWGAKYFFPEIGLEGIKASKGKEPNYYVKSKNMVFAMAYFGTEHTLMTRGGLSEERAAEAYKNILAGYPQFTEKRNKVIGDFITMTQPGGIGSPVVWHDPKDYIESYLGFRRYFTLENNICRCLYQLAENPPQEWLDMQIKVRRRSDRLQTVGGAVRSALFGAAFGIQAANARAAGNHVIQSSGAQITKHLEVKLWGLQPCGCEPFRICPMQVHDEVLAVVSKELASETSRIVSSTVDGLRVKIPLLEIDWHEDIKNWSEKG